MQPNNVKTKIIQELMKETFEYNLAEYINKQPANFKVNIQFQMAGQNRDIYVALVTVTGLPKRVEV